MRIGKIEDIGRSIRNYLFADEPRVAEEGRSALEDMLSFRGAIRTLEAAAHELHGAARLLKPIKPLCGVELDFCGEEERSAGIRPFTEYKSGMARLGFDEQKEFQFFPQWGIAERLVIRAFGPCVIYSVHVGGNYLSMDPRLTVNAGGLRVVPGMLVTVWIKGT